MTTFEEFLKSLDNKSDESNGLNESPNNFMVPVDIDHVFINDNLKKQFMAKHGKEKEVAKFLNAVEQYIDAFSYEYILNLMTGISKFVSRQRPEEMLSTPDTFEIRLHAEVVRKFLGHLRNAYDENFTYIKRCQSSNPDFFTTLKSLASTGKESFKTQSFKSQFEGVAFDEFWRKKKPETMKTMDKNWKKFVTNMYKYFGSSLSKDASKELFKFGLYDLVGPNAEGTAFVLTKNITNATKSAVASTMKDLYKLKGTKEAQGIV